MKKINVGVSVFSTAGANIWNNGINQNIGFLVDLLQTLPEVGKVWLVNGGDTAQMPQELGLKRQGVPLVNPQDITHEVDVVVQMGATLPVEWMRHVHTLGVKIVAFQAGHTFISVTEGPVFGRKSDTIYNGAPIDEVWSLPQHMKSCAPLLRTTLRVPVFEMPHLWDRTFLDESVRAFDDRAHQPFGFLKRERKAGQAWNVGIFEPNISVVKNSTVPMLACEHAYRTERESIGYMRVFNTVHMKEHLTFNRFASHLDLTRAGKASYEPRLVFSEAMRTMELDAVVAHHWECGLNYAYYDALAGGYPLVHNSEFLQQAGVGLYYPHFSAREAGDALLKAWHRPLEYWQAYEATSNAYLDRLSSTDPANQRAFAERLTALAREAV